MRKGTCRYFTGTVNKKCDAGIEYESVIPNGIQPFKAPCMLKYKGSIECSKYEEPTKEELKESEDRIQAFISKLRISGPLIKRLKKKYKGVSKVGVEKCPVCKGRLAFSIAEINGHIWLQCETKDCLSMIE